MRLGVLTALPGELACLGVAAAGDGPVELAPGVLAVVAGVGPERAARAARLLLERGARALASFGVAGGLDPGLDAGALVLASELVEAGGGRLVCDPEWRARLAAALGGALCQGPIVESATVVATRAAKAGLARASGAVAVDMESAALARVAAAAGVPCAALRAVCDPSWRDVPRASLVAVDGRGNLRRARLARALLRRPTDLAGLLALHRGWRRAEQALRAAIARVGSGLLAPALSEQ